MIGKRVGFGIKGKTNLLWGKAGKTITLQMSFSTTNYPRTTKIVI